MFTCVKCNYGTTKKSDWNKHIITKKHKKLLQTHEINNEINPPKKNVLKNKNKNSYITSKKFICEYCGKLYKFRSGLSRHIGKCQYVPNEQLNKVNEKIELEKEQIEKEQIEKEQMEKERM